MSASPGSSGQASGPIEVFLSTRLKRFPCVTVGGGARERGVPSRISASLPMCVSSLRLQVRENCFGGAHESAIGWTAKRGCTGDDIFHLCLHRGCACLYRRSGAGLHRRRVSSLRIGHSKRRSHHGLYDPAASRTQPGMSRLLPHLQARNHAGDAAHAKSAAIPAHQEFAQSPPQIAPQALTVRTLRAMRVKTRSNRSCDRVTICAAVGLWLNCVECGAAPRLP